MIILNQSRSICRIYTNTLSSHFLSISNTIPPPKNSEIPQNLTQFLEKKIPHNTGKTNPFRPSFGSIFQTCSFSRNINHTFSKHKCKCNMFAKNINNDNNKSHPHLRCLLVLFKRSVNVLPKLPPVDLALMHKHRQHPF